jgi:hypothetical protein
MFARMLNKDYNIGICCFSTKHEALSSNIEDWLTWNVSDRSDIYTRNCYISELALCKNPSKRVG